jgi:hypothetical protein
MTIRGLTRHPMQEEIMLPDDLFKKLSEVTPPPASLR